MKQANRVLVDVLRPAATAKTAAFSAKLTPTVAPERFLGVKSADIRAAARALVAGELPVTAAEFRAAAPHPFVELDMVHVRTLNALRDPAEWRATCERFLPHVDNWMVTDAFDPALLRGRRAVGSEAAAAVIAAGRDWLGVAGPADVSACCTADVAAAGAPGPVPETASAPTTSTGPDSTAPTYTVRAGVLVLLQALQKGHFTPEHLEWVAAVRHVDYYVHMAVGWYFATAFEKQPAAARAYLVRPGSLQLAAHRLAVRKIIESRRTSPADLVWARALRSQLRLLASGSASAAAPR